MEELKKIEIEKWTQTIIGTAVTNVEQIELFFGIDWSFFSNFVFDPVLFTDFKILENVETSLDIRLSF